MPPLRPRGLKPGQGAFTDQLPFELSHRRKDAEHEAARRRRGVDLRALTAEHPQAHAAGGQILHGVAQVGEVAARDGRVSRPRARRPSSGRASSCRVRAGRRDCLKRSRGGGWLGRRCLRLARRRAEGPATGNHPPLRRDRNRSACIANLRLGHEGDGAFLPAPACVLYRF